MSSRVRVNSKLTVVSSTPVKPGQSHPLSALDHAMGHHSLHLIFYFSAPASSSHPLHFDRIRPSLCELLSLYPTVTGRLALDGEGNWELKWTDTGVRMLRATVGATIEEWLRTADADEEMDLTAWEELPADPSVWSPFRIQINEFEGGGVAIGLSCTHLLADPSCATMIFKSWTEAHRRQSIGNPPLVHPTALCRTSSKSAAAYSYYESKAKKYQIRCRSPSVNMASATFSFSHSAINHHLSQFHATTSPDATPFDLLAGLFWSRILAAAPTTSTTTKESLSICLDFRKRLHAPLPYGYFGNALHFSLLTLDREELESGDLGRIAESVHRHVSGVEEDHFWASIDWLSSNKDDEGKCAPPFMMYGPELTCVNMEHLIGPISPGGSAVHPLMYMSMFEEDVKPEHVSYRIGNVEGDGLILVVPSPEQGLARRVTVTLPEEQLTKLCQDQIISSLQPKLLLSGGR